MKARFLQWWRGRSLREQRLLLVMFALLAVTFLWLGVYRPIQNGSSSARARHQEAVIGLSEVRAQAASLKSLSAAPALPVPLAPFVTQSATEAGFANATIAPQGDRRATVSIPSARPGPLFGWIAGLERRGVVVERFSVNANNDSTVSVDATLTGGR